jgi:hypothetical protein
MSYGVRQIALPAKEPVSVAEAKNFCKVPIQITDDDSLIGSLITSARIHAENVTDRCLAQRQFILVLDRRPQDHRHYWIGSVADWPMSFHNLRNGINIPKPPLKSVDSLRYIGTDGNPVTLHADTDFIVDRICEPGRIFPIPGQSWPESLHTANAIEVTFTAGYDPDPTAAPDTHNVTSTPPNQQPDSTIVLAIPQVARVAILMLVNHWYTNREPVAAGSVGTVPYHVDALLAGMTVLDFCPIPTISRI